MAFWNRKKPEPPIGLITPMQNMWREYPEDTITPIRLKLIEKEADIGNTSQWMELLDRAAMDYKIASVLRTRKLSIAAAPYRVEPYGGKEATDQDKRVADEAQDFCDSIPNFTQIKMDLLDDHYRGFAAGRLIREMQPGMKMFPGMREMVIDWEPIESRFFKFDKAVTPLVMTEAVPEGEPLPPEYLFKTARDRPGPVTRGGTGRSIARLWVYKGYFMIDMASYIEKYGQPHVSVTIPRHYVEGSVELERAKSAARALIADNIGLVPEGVVIELLESIKQSSNVKDVYLAAIQYCDEGIAMAELGHTLTSGASTVGGLGHGGEAKQAADVKQEIKDYEACGLDDFWNYQVMWPRHRRMWGENVMPPWYCTDVAEEEDEVQVATANKLRAETIQILVAAGMDVSKEQCYRDFELDVPIGDDDKLSPPAPKVPVGPDGMPVEKVAPGDKPKPKGSK